MSRDVSRWRDRVAVISGASAGIGEAVARALVGAGLRVALGARRQDRLAALVSELGAERAWAHPMDVRDMSTVEAFYADLDAHWGRVDVLINNAGVGFRGEQWSQPVDEWEAMLDVNVVGLLRTTQPALKRMIASGEPGHVFNISSMSAYRVAHRTSVYAATKHAARALTEGLRMDLRAHDHPIRVTAISPGFVETEFHGPYMGADAYRALKESYPLLTAEDVASAVLYALQAPDHMQVGDILIRPTGQPN